MIADKLKIHNIPAILWGEDSKRLIIAVHGSHSSKIDDCMWVLAKEAVPLGFQVLSFDLPGHGERVYGTRPCMVQDCVRELELILAFARQRAEQIYIFACSMGAYFSLLAYKDEEIKNALFLSPVTDMERIIHNLMNMQGVTEEQFEKEKIIETPVETLYWDYYCYVKAHPIEKWDCRTSILYGEHDNMCEYEYVLAFADKFHCGLEVHRGGEHWFHTVEQLAYYRTWLRQRLK